MRDPKDVLKLLEEDNLVEKDKVGSGVYYWSFPAVASESVKRKLAAVEADLQREVEREQQLVARKEAVEAQRTEGEQRRSQKMQLLRLEEEKSRLSSVLQQQKDSDPEFLQGPSWQILFAVATLLSYDLHINSVAELVRDTKVAKEAANRWTDNADSARKYLRNKYNCEPPTIKSLFGEEKDYID